MALSRNPQQIGEHDWYYERPGSIEVIHQVMRDGKCIQTDRIRIPWRKLLVSDQRRREDRRRG